MSKITFLFCGCGFLATHIVPNVIPHAKHIVLVDREVIEKENYNNSIFPKSHEQRRKVTALTNLLQELTSIDITPIHEDVKDAGDLVEIQEKHGVDFAIVTFDNIEARKISVEFAKRTGVPTLFVGVTQSVIYIDWAGYLVLPESPEAIARVKAELKRIRDVCTRLEFRPLGALASGLAYFAITQWINAQEKNMFDVSVTDTVRVTNIKR